MRKGLTLMELLVAISILTTLAALLYPVYWNIRTRTDITVCADQLRQIGIALKMYARDHGDDTPYGMPPCLEALYPHYIRNRDFFVCPTFRKFAGKEIEKVHNFHSRLAGYQTAWHSYWEWEPRGLDHRYRENKERGIWFGVWISFSEVYAKRGDNIPILMCQTHRQGCPHSNASYVIYFFPKLFSGCHKLANPSAPVLILRWNGAVSLVHGQLSDTQAILLNY